VAVSNIPDRNPFFTGREQVLVQIQEALAAQGRAALSGLGGVGKTETALEYAYLHLDEYAYTFWVNADSREAIASDYAVIAGLLRLSLAEAHDQTFAVNAVKHWLSSHQHWLLILDNADDLAMAGKFIPSGQNGHVLLTTRARAVGPIAQRFDIEKMGPVEGALFLLRRAKGIAKDTPLEAVVEVDRGSADEITSELGGLPLALDQAASYIEETGCGLSGYLDVYRKYAPELLRQRGELATRYTDPVATTWVLAFEKIHQADPAASELLKLCAFLHPDGIPEEVFRKGAPELGPELERVASDTFAWHNALGKILKHSLLFRDSNTHTIEIHRLVQAVLKQSMGEETKRICAERAVRAVNRAFPIVTFSSWPLCERLLSQAHICAELINHWGFEFPEAAQLLNNAGFYSFKRGRYTDAAPLYQRALAIREKALGPEHPDVATSLNNLAWLYGRQGQYAKAAPLYQRALAIWEKDLGPEHPDVARSLNSLATLHVIQGQYAKAEPLYQRALAIWEKTLGPEHPDVATSLNTGALLYKNQGQYAKAEPLYQRALAIQEKTLGREHPKVATSLSNLAGLYQSMGDCVKAEPLYQRALAIREKAFGPEHPDVAWNLNGLAELYDTQGRHAQAEPLYQRALAIWEKALCIEDPHGATCLDNYAHCLRAMNRSEEAEPLEARARTIRAKLR
jgi:tetratricopeptide (TPR) repeat protein